MKAHTNCFRTRLEENRSGGVLVQSPDIPPPTADRRAAAARAFTHGRESCWLADGKDGRSVAASPALAAPVGVSSRGLAVFGPPAEDLIGAVVAAAAGHARRGLVDLKPRFWREGGDVRRAPRCSCLGRSQAGYSL